MQKYKYNTGDLLKIINEQAGLLEKKDMTENDITDRQRDIQTNTVYFT